MIINIGRVLFAQITSCEIYKALRSRHTHFKDKKIKIQRS